MSDLQTLTGSQYLSYSGLDNLLTCGEKFRLQKIVSVPQQDAWYLLGGSAVHDATEMLDLGIHEDPQKAWDEAWGKQLANVTNFDTVRAGGRATKEYPNKEDRSWWEKHGPQQVSAWQQWMQARLAEGWTLLGVEIPFQITLGDTPVRGFIDRAFADPNGEVELWDLKAGSRAPASTVQLGVYRHGLLQSQGIDAYIGRYFMTRHGAPDYMPPQHALGIYTEEMLARWFARAKAIIEGGLFVPHVGPLCSSCTVAQYCEAIGGTPPHFSSPK